MPLHKRVLPVPVLTLFSQTEDSARSHARTHVRLAQIFEQRADATAAMAECNSAVALDAGDFVVARRCVQLAVNVVRHWSLSRFTRLTRLTRLTRRTAGTLL